jgi:hypothetical protein
MNKAIIVNPIKEAVGACATKKQKRIDSPGKMNKGPTAKKCTEAVHRRNVLETEISRVVSFKGSRGPIKKCVEAVHKKKNMLEAMSVGKSLEVGKIVSFNKPVVPSVRAKK